MNEIEQLRTMLGLPSDGSGAQESTSGDDAAEVGALRAIKFRFAEQPVVAEVYAFADYDAAMALLTALWQPSDDEHPTRTVNGSYLVSFDYPAGDPAAEKEATRALSSFAGDE